MTTNDRVFEISQSVGFNNEYYFNRRFKEHVGISQDNIEEIKATIYVYLHHS